VALHENNETPSKNEVEQKAVPKPRNVNIRSASISGTSNLFKPTASSLGQMRIRINTDAKLNSAEENRFLHEIEKLDAEIKELETQKTTFRDENSHLRRKAADLEKTNDLLKVATTTKVVQQDNTSKLKIDKLSEQNAQLESKLKESRTEITILKKTNK